MRHRVCLVLIYMLFVYSEEVSAQGAVPLRSTFFATATDKSEHRGGPQTYRLYYRWDEVNIDRTYLDNEENIRDIISHLHNSPKIDSIAIYSYASPEGVYEHNAQLALSRARAAKRFILANLPKDSGLDGSMITLHPVAENWQGLREAAERGYHRWDRRRVLAILDDRSISDATREWRLRQLDGGVSWKWMRIHLMPELRLAMWICVWESPRTETLETIEAPEDRLKPQEDGLVFSPALIQRKRLRTIAALKTNLLYDAVTALNFAVEIPLGKHFSLQYEHICPWWNAGPGGNKYCLQLLSMGGEARWWFLPRTREWYDPQVLSGELRQRDALMGHYLGVYGDGGKFDIQIGAKFGCYQSSFWGAGLSYGYTMPVGRWANMEFSLSVGYMAIDYQHYTPTPDWSLLIKDTGNAGRLHWFGPTKAKVSLVVPIIVRTGRKAR